MNAQDHAKNFNNMGKYYRLSGKVIIEFFEFDLGSAYSITICYSFKPNLQVCNSLSLFDIVILPWLEKAVYSINKDLVV